MSSQQKRGILLVAYLYLGKILETVSHTVAYKLYFCNIHLCFVK